MFDHHEWNAILQALAMCLVLTGVHGYLGIHVLERKVIFVDLAMAQIAALGATWALFLGYDPEHHPGTVYAFSLGSTLIGAAVFSLTRARHEKVPQEALIGIVYATASAVAILILARSADAGEHLKGMLVGNILLARWGAIGQTAAIYALIGLFHWRFRDRFFKISFEPEAAYASGMNVRLWDFLFYASFGVVITSSVAIAGVLLVFCFLVVPACIAVLFAASRAARILVAWGAGTLVSVTGIGWTFIQGDLPAGPVVVAAFAAVLAAAGVVNYVRTRPLGPALARVAVGAAAVALLVGGSLLLRNAPEALDHEHEAGFDALLAELKSPDETTQLHAIDHFLAEPDPHAVDPLLELLGRTSSGRVLEQLAATLRKIGDPKAGPPLLQAARPGLDAPLRLELAAAAADLREPAALGTMLAIAADPQAPRLARVKALRAFTRLTGRAGSLDDPASLARLQAWWSEHGDHLRWRENTGRFE